MAAPIQRLARLASKTFYRFNSDGFQVDRLTQLKASMNAIIAADVNFDPEAVKTRDDRLTQKRERPAPVSYIHLWEDDTFSMGIFIVKSGGRLPLHDHPGMFGLLKVIHGTLRVVSLTEVEGVPIQPLKPQSESLRHGRDLTDEDTLVKSVKLESDGALTATQDCCMLTPTVGNFHEITSVNDMAAFLDILAPPYDLTDRIGVGSRDCHYYKVLPETSSSVSDKDLKFIIRTEQPADFWCDSIEYTGPELDTCLQNNI